MKVTIEFDGYEDAEEMRTALDGGKWKGTMWKLDQELRQVTKYHSIEGVKANEEQIKNAEYWRERLRSLLYDANINLD